MSKEITKETMQVLQWLRTEIMAGTAIFPEGERALGWNDATARAMTIVDKYVKGEGLFQQ